MVLTETYVSSMSNTVLKQVMNSEHDVINGGSNLLAYGIRMFDEKFPDHMVTFVSYHKTEDGAEDPVGVKCAKHEWVIYGEKILDMIK